MIKSDLIAVMEKQGNLAHVEAQSVVNTCFQAMIEALYEDERIEIRGFGSFVNRNYRSYEGKNPKSGRTIKVPAKKAPFFRAGKGLKELIDAGKDKFIIKEV